MIFELRGFKEKRHFKTLSKVKVQNLGGFLQMGKQPQKISSSVASKREVENQVAIYVLQ